jgi:hypothetical protein
LKIKCRTCGSLFDTLSQWKLHCNEWPACNNAYFDVEHEAADKMPKVEPTPSLPDEFMKLLDNGWRVTLFKNQLGSYTAKAKHVPTSRKVITDDFTPSKALYRLTEKAITGRIVGAPDERKDT